MGVRDVHTFLQLLQAFESDLQFVVVGELGGVVEDVHPKKRDQRHLGRFWSTGQMRRGTRGAEYRQQGVQVNVITTKNNQAEKVVGWSAFKTIFVVSWHVGVAIGAAPATVVLILST